MPEAEGIFLADGENIADVSPWEYDAVVEDAGNGFTLDAAAAIHGTKGYKIAFGGINDGAYGYRSFAPQTDLCVRTYFYLPALHYPHVGNGAIQYWFTCLIRDQTTGSYAASVMMYTSSSVHYIRRIYYRTNAGYIDAAAVNAVVPLDVPFFIEIHYKTGDGTGLVELSLNGTILTSISGLINDDVIPHGSYSGTTGGGANPANGEYFYIDDIKVDTQFIGAYGRIGRSDNAVMVTREGMIDRSWFGLVEHKK